MSKIGVNKWRDMGSGVTTAFPPLVNAVEILQAYKDEPTPLASQPLWYE